MSPLALLGDAIAAAVVVTLPIWALWAAPVLIALAGRWIGGVS